ncbi:MAG: type II toxin-antitoxin system Phd/YefM family antitoxin [Candidatus Hinthialibacter antarcticus]|nr:type II toxin-antitoxin system Phd/YefM family antitoxin [Candidatus Hinthialibacter antarcticus]
MLNLDNICSLSEFQRNTKSVLEHIKQTGLPQVLTVNGKAEVVVQDAASYQKILNLLDRLEAIEGIERGLKSMKQGKGRPADEVLQRLASKFDIPTE